MRYLLVALISLLTLAACDNGSSNSSNREIPSPEPAHSLADDIPAIPDDVSYKIIDSTTIPGIKRSINVRLNRTVSEDVLRAIALKLKDDDPHSYERTFIFYYVPGMTVDAGAWARTHFNPELELHIMGLTPAAEKALLEAPVSSDREIVGRWLDQRPFVGCRITIFRENGMLYLESLFPDGSAGKREITERPSTVGRRFEKIEGSSEGDHWIVVAGGNLQLRDNAGLIATMEAIE